MSLSKTKRLNKYPSGRVYSAIRTAEVKAELLEIERGKTSHLISKRVRVALRGRDLERQKELSNRVL